MGHNDREFESISKNADSVNSKTIHMETQIFIFVELKLRT